MAAFFSVLSGFFFGFFTGALFDNRHAFFIAFRRFGRPAKFFGARVGHRTRWHPSREPECHRR
jgi:hypothetical protein